ncbi:23S rRNA (guanosine(2251)-2'-O)-methyltransferase RlmB [Candidatus Beckwithbacteria bacterium]|nr:23S rRNA (guanosine(2251)-2'-O)-methyltransferase RlmB [Candidatus Beckwithbacteria bacterium]
MRVKQPSKRFSRNENITRQIEGRNPVMEALRAGTSLTQVFIEENVNQDDKIERINQLIWQKKIKKIRVSRKKLDRMSKTGGQHQGIIAIAEVGEEKNLNEIIANLWQTKKNPFFLVLSGVVYEHNLGAVLRTAESCQVDAVIVPNKATGLTPVVSRTSAGASEHVVLIHDNLFNVFKTFQKIGVKIVGATEKANRSIYRTNLTGPLAIVMGMEDTGISPALQKYLDAEIRIQMLGQMESLNMSVSAAVCLYEAVRQRRYNE